MTTPTINVNLKPCTCHFREADQRGNDHPYPCPAAPIPLPCPIQRTVEMTVRLGECNDMPSCGLREHHAHCPARPIRVTCTIGGETWAESEIAWTDVAEQECSALRTANARGHAERLVRDLWKIVKALVTGKRGVDEFTPPPQCLALMEQRDAVFAALADLARDEDMHEANRHALFAACPAIFPRGGVSPRPLEDRPSSRNLAAYVSHLIAKVGAL